MLGIVGVTRILFQKGMLFMRNSEDASSLTENEVVDAVCKWLEPYNSPSYHIESRCNTNQTGNDIVAIRLSDNLCLHVEAKGATSSKSSSKRFGKPFNRAQIRVHIGQALRKAAEMLSQEHNSHRVAIALPDTSIQRDEIGKIKPMLDRWGIGVFWVERDGTIESDSPWEL